jgi:hypothetical protein
MRVFAIIQVGYDYDPWELLKDIGRDLDKLKKTYNDLPMFSNDQVDDNDFEKPEGDGAVYYYYEEYDV